MVPATLEPKVTFRQELFVPGGAFILGYMDEKAAFSARYGRVDYRRRWSSRAAHAVHDFVSREWKWLFWFAAAAAGLALAYARLPHSLL